MRQTIVLDSGFTSFDVCSREIEVKGRFCREIQAGVCFQSRKPLKLAKSESEPILLKKRHA